VWGQYTCYIILRKQTPWIESESELYRPSYRRLSANLVPNWADRGCRVVSATDPHGRQFRFSRPETLFSWNSISIILMRLSGPHSRYTTSQRIWYRRESNPDLSICSQELYRPSYSRLSAKLVSTLVDRGCRVVSGYFLEIGPQLSSWGWVDPTLDPLLLRKYGSSGNWTRDLSSVARNSDH
jgi:hypothetical protein